MRQTVYQNTIVTDDKEPRSVESRVSSRYRTLRFRLIHLLLTWLMKVLLMLHWLMIVVTRPLQTVMLLKDKKNPFYSFFQKFKFRSFISVNCRGNGIETAVSIQQIVEKCRDEECRSGQRDTGRNF